MSSPKEEHEKKAPKTLNFALVTVSSSRYAAKLRGEEVSDKSQEVAAEVIEKSGHKVVYRGLVDDDLELIRLKLLELSRDETIDVIVFIGGTGLAKRDVTIEAVKPLIEKEAPGFGELFRWLSFQEIGAAAFLSRAMLGTMKGKAVVCLPGSPNAVELALKSLLPAFPHLIYIIRS